MLWGGLFVWLLLLYHTLRLIIHIRVLVIGAEHLALGQSKICTLVRLFAFILSVVTENMDGGGGCATEVIQMGVGLLTLQPLHVVWSLAIACSCASLDLFSQDYTRRANRIIIRFNTALFLFFTFLFVLRPPVLSDSSRVHLIASLDSSLSPLSLLFSLAHSLYSVPSSSSSFSFFLPRCHHLSICLLVNH